MKGERERGNEANKREAKKQGVWKEKDKEVENTWLEKFLLGPCSDSVYDGICLLREEFVWPLVLTQPGICTQGLFLKPLPHKRAHPVLALPDSVAAGLGRMQLSDPQ